MHVNNPGTLILNAKQCFKYELSGVLLFEYNGRHESFINRISSRKAKCEIIYDEYNAKNFNLKFKIIGEEFNYNKFEVDLVGNKVIGSDSDHGTFYLRKMCIDNSSFIITGLSVSFPFGMSYLREDIIEMTFIFELKEVDIKVLKFRFEQILEKILFLNNLYYDFI